MHFPERMLHYKQVIQPSRSTWKKSAMNSKENYLHLQIMLLRRITTEFGIRNKEILLFPNGRRETEFPSREKFKKGLDTTCTVSVFT